MQTAAQQNASQVRALLRFGPARAANLIEKLRISQPTLSRTIQAMGDEVVLVGAGKTVQYAIHDASRAHLRALVYRITPQGTLEPVGTLVPICPSGFVTLHAEGKRIHSDGLPWWMADLKPEGFVGRALARRFGAALSVPTSCSEWSDEQLLRALLAHGYDLPGDLLIGSSACEHFLNAPAPAALPFTNLDQAYADLSQVALSGEVTAWVGGEVPKFTAYVQQEGAEAAHVIVKFSKPEQTPAAQRWRDLLLAEHIALRVLTDAGIDAASSSVVDHGAQRFLQLKRFDRVAALGRRSVHTLATLDAEFAGCAGTWPAIAKALSRAGVITTLALDTTCLLWAFGTLIGNTDMHSGNLACYTDNGQPYDLAPAYDMTPMAFAPTPEGNLTDRGLTLNIADTVPAATWHKALALAQNYVHRLRHSDGFSADFSPCITQLQSHVDLASQRIQRLAKL
jgi:hypothetical protein